MSGALNMTLDEIVKRGKTARSGGRGISRGRGRGRGGGGRGAGPARRGPLAVNARPSSFTINKPVRRVRSLPWQSGLFEDGLRAAGASGVEVGTRLHVTNLDQGVTNEDIRELFSEIGEVERYAIHYDKNGRPSGTAEVVYPRRSDAFQALKKYNNVLLDGRPMRLEILGGNNSSEAPLSGRVNVNVTGLNGRLKRTVVIQQGGGGRGRVRGGRGGRGPAPTVSRRLPIHKQVSVFCLLKKLLKLLLLSSHLSEKMPSNCEILCEIIIAILLPPLGVCFRKGCCTVEFLICLVLTILGYVPGIIYAIYVIVFQHREEYFDEYRRPIYSA